MPNLVGEFPILFCAFLFSYLVTFHFQFNWSLFLINNRFHFAAYPNVFFVRYPKLMAHIHATDVTFFFGDVCMFVCFSLSFPKLINLFDQLFKTMNLFLFSLIWTVTGQKNFLCSSKCYIEQNLLRLPIWETFFIFFFFSSQSNKFFLH